MMLKHLKQRERSTTPVLHIRLQINPKANKNDQQQLTVLLDIQEIGLTAKIQVGLPSNCYMYKNHQLWEMMSAHFSVAAIFKAFLATRIAAIVCLWLNNKLLILLILLVILISTQVPFSTSAFQRLMAARVARDPVASETVS